VTPVPIAYIINSLKLGGGERFLMDLCMQIPRDQFTPDVICLYYKGELGTLLERSGISVTVLNIPRKIGFVGYKIVQSALQRGRYKIVHAHLLEGCWYGLPAAWAANIPVRVAHLQNCHWNLPLKLRILDRIAFQFAHAAFGCSQAVLNFYRKRMWYQASKLNLVYNSVDVDRFRVLPDKNEAKRDLGLPNKIIVIATVASLTPQKGHKYLLEAAREIISKYPDVWFLLVGDGELKEQLRDLRDRWKLRPQVIFLGARPDIPKILAAADIFVLPSLWEGLPLVLIEAGLTGLPVVACKVDGVVEIIQEGHNGFLVLPKDANSLAKAIQALVEEPRLRREMGESGRTVASTCFDMKKIIPQITALYNDLLERTEHSGKGHNI